MGLLRPIVVLLRLLFRSWATPARERLDLLAENIVAARPRRSRPPSQWLRASGTDVNVGDGELPTEPVAADDPIAMRVHHPEAQFTPCFLAALAVAMNSRPSRARNDKFDS